MQANDDDEIPEGYYGPAVVVEHTPMEGVPDEYDTTGKLVYVDDDGEEYFSCAVYLQQDGCVGSAVEGAGGYELCRSTLRIATDEDLKTRSWVF